MNIFRRKSGFTIIEVAFALALLASTAVMIGTGIMSAKLKQNQDEDMLTGVFLANNKMIELETEIDEDIAKNKFPDEIEKTGGFDEPYDIYKWEYHIKKVEIPLAEGGEDGSSNQIANSGLQAMMQNISKAVREVKVKVFWGGDDDNDEKPQEVVLTTHIVDYNAK